MQVIGKVGFGKCFGAMESLDHPAEGDAFKVIATGAPYTQLSHPSRRMPFRLWQAPGNIVSKVRPSSAGFEEVAKRLSNPVRKYMLWDEVSGCAAEPVSRCLVGITSCK